MSKESDLEDEDFISEQQTISFFEEKISQLTECHFDDRCFSCYLYVTRKLLHTLKERYLKYFELDIELEDDEGYSVGLLLPHPGSNVASEIHYGKENLNKSIAILEEQFKDGVLQPKLWVPPSEIPYLREKYCEFNIKTIESETGKSTSFQIIGRKGPNPQITNYFDERIKDLKDEYLHGRCIATMIVPTCFVPDLKEKYEKDFDIETKHQEEKDKTTFRLLLSADITNPYSKNNLEKTIAYIDQMIEDKIDNPRLFVPSTEVEYLKKIYRYCESTGRENDKTILINIKGEPPKRELPSVDEEIPSLASSFYDVTSYFDICIGNLHKMNHNNPCFASHWVPISEVEALHERYKEYKVDTGNINSEDDLVEFKLIRPEEEEEPLGVQMAKKNLELLKKDIIRKIEMSLPQSKGLLVFEEEIFPTYHQVLFEYFTKEKFSCHCDRTTGKISIYLPQ